jgi:hypothetical protein
MPSLTTVTILSLGQSAADYPLGTTSYFTSWPLSLLLLFNYYLGFLNTKYSSQLYSCSFSPPALGKPNISLLKDTDPII